MFAFGDGLKKLFYDKKKDKKMNGKREKSHECFIVYM